MIPQSPKPLRRRLRIAAGVSLIALAAVWLVSAAARAADPDKAVDKIKTASPIKHVLIIVGENRSFDHVFATYTPKGRDESVSNLLSKLGMERRTEAAVFAAKLPPKRGLKALRRDLEAQRSGAFERARKATESTRYRTLVP